MVEVRSHFDNEAKGMVGISSDEPRGLRWPRSLGVSKRKAGRIAQSIDTKADP
jgi:hypothetical protein